MMMKIKIISLVLFFSTSLSLFAEEKDETPKLRSNSLYAGYSALIPGLGQIKKDRVYTGIFILTIFGASVLNLKENWDNFNSKRSDYERNTFLIQVAMINNSDTLNSIPVAIAVSSLYYKDYANTAVKSNNAIQYMGLIYFAQILHAYFCSPGSAFQKKVESKVSEPSNFHFSFSPTRNQFGQTGMNLDINYTWRF